MGGGIGRSGDRSDAAAAVRVAPWSRISFASHLAFVFVRSFEQTADENAFLGVMRIPVCTESVREHKSTHARAVVTKKKVVDLLFIAFIMRKLPQPGQN